MTWREIKDSIRADLLARGLKEPRIRLSALDRLEKLLGDIWPNFLSNPEILLSVGKEVVSKELARRKEIGSLNSAEKSVLNMIFARLAEASVHSSVSRESGELYPPATASHRRATVNVSDEGTNLKIGLPPIINEDSRILILGTMPGDDSLRLKQYYANINNQFWKILSKVYEEVVEAEYPQRLEFLHRRGLALWDVLRCAERAGSLDSAIKNEVINDFAGLLRIHTSLKAIVFNGGKAQTLFLRYVERSQPTVASASLRKIVLPSTSPTPGKNVLSFEEKVVRWASLTTL
jgi:hypoxanthine-DNA glycosylase